MQKKKQTLSTVVFIPESFVFVSHAAMCMCSYTGGNNVPSLDWASVYCIVRQLGVRFSACYDSHGSEGEKKNKKETEKIWINIGGVKKGKKNRAQFFFQDLGCKEKDECCLHVLSLEI